MKKKVFGRHFSRSRRAREALFKSLIKALILHGKINTTLAKAKGVQADVDKVVTLAKIGGVSKEREIASVLSADRRLVGKLTKEIAPAFKERRGGFTRIIKLPLRKGDAAEIARLEWIEEIKEVSKVEKVPPVRQAQGKKVSKAKKKTEIKKTKKSKDHGP